MTSLPGQKGFSFSLALLDWDIFATLTFKNLSTECKRWQQAWSHLQDAGKSLAVPYSELLIALRSEHGEQGGRPHFHYLLGGTGAKSNLSLAFRLRYWWHQRTGGGAEVRAYDWQLAGADYIEKCLSGANEYELKKFNSADRLEVSDSVFRRIQRMRRYEADRAASAEVQHRACRTRGNPVDTREYLAWRGRTAWPERPCELDPSEVTAVRSGLADNPTLTQA